MMWASGVGSYIRHLVPKVISARPQDRFYLLGKTDEMGRVNGFKRANVTWIPMTSDIYTIREQWEMIRRIPANTDLFWAPFYNFPFCWRGKLLVTVHDVFHLAMAAQAGGIHLRLYAKFMVRNLVRKAKANLAVSHLA